MSVITVSRNNIARWAEHRKMAEGEVVALLTDEDGPTFPVQIDKLFALAKTLRVPFTSLVMDREMNDLDSGVKLSRRTEGYERSSDRAGVQYYTYRHLATTDADPGLMALHVTVHAHDEENLTLNKGHGSKELIYVLDGPIKMDWEYDGQFHNCLIHTGDSVYIEPYVPHSFMSTVAGKDAQLIAINYG